MHKARHDAAILGALSATVALILGLATPSYGRVEVAAMPHAAPSTRAAPHSYPAFREPAATHEATPAPSAETETASREVAPSNAQPEAVERDGEIDFVGGYGDPLDEDDGEYWASNYAWELRYFHLRNRWQQQMMNNRERTRRARLFDVLSPGEAVYGAAQERRFDPCAVFSRACAGARSSAPTGVSTHVATLTRRGVSWLLANDVTTVNVNPERLCALTTGTSSALASNPALSFATPEPAQGCEVVETGSESGVAVAITWQGNGWSQRAIVSLGDDAESPEATVSVVRANGGGHTSTFLANLSGAPMEWRIEGRTVTVAPGAMTRIRA